MRTNRLLLIELKIIMPTKRYFYSHWRRDFQRKINQNYLSAGFRRTLLGSLQRSPDHLAGFRGTGTLGKGLGTGEREETARRENEERRKKPRGETEEKGKRGE